MRLFFDSHSPRAFGYIGGYRNCGSTQLVAQSVILGFRKFFQQPIDVNYQFTCFVPSIQLLKLK